jgi:C1A family cysteine protease
MSAMRATLRDDGQPEEAAWPYIAAEIRDLSSWVPPSAAPRLFRRDSDHCDATVDAIVAMLEAGTPVLMIMSVSSSFDYGWDEDFVVAGSETPEPKRRHAVVVVASGNRAGQKLLMVRNSWGEGWADGGYAWLDIDYLKPRLIRASILTKEI